jgi:hypothetical protein
MAVQDQGLSLSCFRLHLGERIQEVQEAYILGVGELQVLLPIKGQQMGHQQQRAPAGEAGAPQLPLTLQVPMAEMVAPELSGSYKDNR